MYSNVRCIARMFGGLSLGARRSHTWSHAAVKLPFLSPWALNLVRKSVRYLAAMSIRPRPPFSVRRCRVESVTCWIAPFQMYRDMAVASFHTCSFGTVKSCVICHILASKWVYTYWIRCVRHSSLPYTSLASDQTCPVTLVQLVFPDCAIELVKLKPRTVMSGNYGMPIMLIAVSHKSVANALDFPMFKLAPVAFS